MPHLFMYRLRTSTLHPLLAHHHLHYINDCYVYDVTFLFLSYLYMLLSFKCIRIISFMIAAILFHLLFSNLEYVSMCNDL